MMGRELFSAYYKRKNRLINLSTFGMSGRHVLEAVSDITLKSDTISSHVVWPVVYVATFDAAYTDCFCWCA